MTVPSTSPLPLLLACGGSFLAFIDVTIANLAVPSLAFDYPGAGLGTLSWVVSLYAVVFAAGLAPLGRLADVLGRRTLFVGGVVIFTAASLAAAVAPDVGVLLAARGVQALGAAAMIPSSLGLVLAHTAPERRVAALGWWTASASAAAVAGPVLGGVLVDLVSWRALFLVNVPLGVVLAGAALRLPSGERRSGRLPDLTGSLVLGAAVGLIVLVVTECEQWGWGSPAVLGGLAVGAAGLAAVVRRSRRHPVPALEVSLWRHPTYATATMVSVLFGIAMYSWLLVTTIFLMEIWGYSALEAGLAVTPGALASAVVSIGLSRSARRPSPRALVLAGSAAVAASGIWLGLGVPPEPAYLLWMVPAGLVGGAGIGAISVGVAGAASLSAPPASFAAATGLTLAARQVGGGLGVAAMVALLAAAGADPVAGPRSVYLMSAIACLAMIVLAPRLRVLGAGAAPVRVAVAAKEEAA
ncbi:MAG: MFS transporter [Actinomycetota bacterium]|nr:MFS transporter [Actinomycetota bacterium]